MKRLSCMVLPVIFVLLLLFVAQTIGSMSPTRKVIANVRGKQYHVEAETIDEFSHKLEKLVGLSKSQQNILYRGKRLRKSDRFDKLNIHDGDILNVMKGRGGSSPGSVLQARTRGGPVGAANSLLRKSQDKAKSPPAASKSLIPGAMFNNMGSDDMKATMEQINSMIDSDFFDKLFENEEQLEMTRLQLFSNLEKYESVMPGFKKSYEEIASDPEKWRAAMMEAKEQISRIKQQNKLGRSPKPRPGHNQDRGRSAAKSKDADTDDVV